LHTYQFGIILTLVIIMTCRLPCKKKSYDSRFIYQVPSVESDA
jgi:hypothetical protein